MQQAESPLGIRGCFSAKYGFSVVRVWNRPNGESGFKNAVNIEAIAYLTISKKVVCKTNWHNDKIRVIFPEILFYYVLVYFKNTLLSTRLNLDQINMELQWGM